VQAICWRSGRRVIASLQLLFFALNGSGIEEVDVFDGGGCSDGEMNVLLRLELLTRSEIERLKKYPGFKAFIPIKWALDDLRESLAFKDRYDLASESFEKFEDLVVEFQRRCTRIVKLLEQPVPLAYFHVLIAQMVIVQVLVGYALISVFPSNPFFSILAYVVCLLLMLGLQEIAVAMSDPFGTDDTDFDTTRLVEDAYNNMISYLREDFVSLPDDLASVHNPLGVSDSRKTAAELSEEKKHLTRYSAFNCGLSGERIWTDINTM